MTEIVPYETLLPYVVQTGVLPYVKWDTSAPASIKRRLIYDLIALANHPASVGLSFRILNATALPPGAEWTDWDSADPDAFYQMGPPVEAPERAVAGIAGERADVMEVLDYRAGNDRIAVVDVLSRIVAGVDAVVKKHEGLA